MKLYEVTGHSVSASTQPYQLKDGILSECFGGYMFVAADMTDEKCKAYFKDVLKRRIVAMIAG